MSNRYQGGVISATAPTTSTSAASGVWTLQQQLQAKAAGNWTGIPLVIGQAYQGGFYAGQISTAGNGIADFNLVVGPKSSSQTFDLWKNSNDATSGADSAFNGTQNTADMVADGNSTVYPSAHFCNDLSTGGQTDWYMPSKNELEICYYNLKPTTALNFTNSGTNTNAVPSRGSNYTTGNPARTTATVFQSGGSEAFDDERYWSSTEASATNAWRQYMGYGYQSSRAKNVSCKVRAIRRVAV